MHECKYVDSANNGCTFITYGTEDCKDNKGALQQYNNRNLKP